LQGARAGVIGHPGREAVAMVQQQFSRIFGIGGIIFGAAGRKASR
jgi:hypothetical protein